MQIYFHDSFLSVTFLTDFAFISSKGYDNQELFWQINRHLVYSPSYYKNFVITICPIIGCFVKQLHESLNAFYDSCTTHTAIKFWEAKTGPDVQVFTKGGNLDCEAFKSVKLYIPRKVKTYGDGTLICSLLWTCNRQVTWALHFGHSVIYPFSDPLYRAFHYFPPSIWIWFMIWLYITCMCIVIYAMTVYLKYYEMYN